MTGNRVARRGQPVPLRVSCAVVLHGEEGYGAAIYLVLNGIFLLAVGRFGWFLA
jgi:hypothetical protein